MRKNSVFHLIIDNQFTVRSCFTITIFYRAGVQNGKTEKHDEFFIQSHLITEVSWWIFQYFTPQGFITFRHKPQDLSWSLWLSQIFNSNFLLDSLYHIWTDTNNFPCPVFPVCFYLSSLKPSLPEGIKKLLVKLTVCISICCFLNVDILSV